MLIGGELVTSESGRTYRSINPANEEVLSEVPEGSSDDVERAVDAATAAQGKWQALGVAVRAEMIRQFADDRRGQRGLGHRGGPPGPRAGPDRDRRR